MTHTIIYRYDSTWYCIPLKAQKLLLFIMLKSSQQYEFNLSGLFVPCYEGFLTVITLILNNVMQCNNN